MGKYDVTDLAKPAPTGGYSRWMIPVGIWYCVCRVIGGIHFTVDNKILPVEGDQNNSTVLLSVTKLW